MNEHDALSQEDQQDPAITQHYAGEEKGFDSDSCIIILGTKIDYKKSIGSSKQVPL